MVNSQKYSVTKAVYNGTVSYPIFQKTCLKEYPGSQPCTSEDLLKGFWLFTAKTTEVDIIVSFQDYVRYW